MILYVNVIAGSGNDMNRLSLLFIGTLQIVVMIFY